SLALAVRTIAFNEFPELAFHVVTNLSAMTAALVFHLRAPVPAECPSIPLPRMIRDRRLRQKEGPVRGLVGILRRLFLRLRHIPEEQQLEQARGRTVVEALLVTELARIPEGAE